jgi:GH24 family phage-related lysozyme (muramidase)
MGAPAALVEKLAPYLGLKKEFAREALAAHPLILTQEEAKTLDDAVRRSYIKDSQRRFDKKSAIRFEDVPRQVQAVCVSLEYQLGPGGAKKYVALLTQSDYAGAAAKLREAVNYAPRRKAEAAILMEVNSPAVAILELNGQNPAPA